MMGIAEMFGELDGYDRYWEAVAIDREYTVASQRKYRAENSERVRLSQRRYRSTESYRDRVRLYQREYRREHADNPQWREKRRQYERELRIRKHGICERPYGPVQVAHGTVNAYVNRGCRCRACTDAAVAKSREQRARRKPETA